MNQKVLHWASLQKKQWPGAFREKDLQILFSECCEIYNKLTELNKQKQELSGKHQTNSFDYSPIKESSRQMIDSARKKTGQNKYKCPLKSCGKVMNSQFSFSAHMKKHNDKRKRGLDHLQHSQQNVLQQ